MAITIKNILTWKKSGTLDRARATSATSKGHKHIANQTFKSINHIGVPPAVYRHEHLEHRGKGFARRLKKIKQKRGQ